MAHEPQWQSDQTALHHILGHKYSRPLKLYKLPLPLKDDGQDNNNAMLACLRARTVLVLRALTGPDPHRSRRLTLPPPKNGLTGVWVLGCQ